MTNSERAHPNSVERRVSPEELATKVIEQNDRLKSTLQRQKLEANGFKLYATSTRRGVYETLLERQSSSFAPGYKPTMAELCDKRLGRDNWDTVHTGVIRDEVDPTGNETPDITAWQNAEVQIFTRNTVVAAVNPQFLTAPQIKQSIMDEFPDVTSGPVQA